MSNTITITIDVEDAGYLWHTGHKSFYHGEGQEGRFVPIGKNSTVKDILDITPNQEADQECSMHFCHTFLDATVWKQVLINEGYKAMLLSDEYDWESGDWAVLSNKPMKFHN